MCILQGTICPISNDSVPFFALKGGLSMSHQNIQSCTGVDRSSKCYALQTSMQSHALNKERVCSGRCTLSGPEEHCENSRANSRSF